MIGINRVEPSSLDSEEFVPNESVWSVPIFGYGNKLKAGLIKPRMSGWIRDGRLEQTFEVTNGILKLEQREFGIRQLDRSQLVLDVLESGRPTNEWIQFHKLTAQEDAEVAWDQKELVWGFLLAQVMGHIIWVPQMAAAVIGMRFGKRITSSKRRAWLITALGTTFVGAVIGMMLGEIAVIINNRNTLGWTSELASPPLLFILFGIINLPIGVRSGFLRIRKMQAGGLQR